MRKILMISLCGLTAAIIICLQTIPLLMLVDRCGLGVCIGILYIISVFTVSLYRGMFYVLFFLRAIAPETNYPTFPYLFLSSSTQSYDLPEDDLIKEGDIMLGCLFPLSTAEHNTKCGSKVRSVAVQGAQSVMYLVDKINADPSILPNVTIGYAILNDCGRGKVRCRHLRGKVKKNKNMR